MTVSQFQKLQGFLTFHPEPVALEGRDGRGCQHGKEHKLTMQSPLPLLASWEAQSKVATGTWHFNFLSWPWLCCQNL